TSELIANDALRLSLLIQDVLGFDSNVVPLKMYARADFFIYKQQYDSANMTLDSLESQFKYHVLIDEVYYLKGKIAELTGNFRNALSYYKIVYTEYPQELLADLCIYYSALIYEEKLDDIQNSLSLYEKIILEYPESVYVIDSRKRFRKNRELTEEEIFKQEPSSIKP
ncbi:MAG: tetratricopeptide repeat protein, partial [Bacteroidetes bacterium]|nr:tetratricopeptide repeat protein [Bacteroidota bacterium]